MVLPRYESYVAFSLDAPTERQPSSAGVEKMIAISTH